MSSESPGKGSLLFGELRVECHAGHKADETPVRFFLDDRRYEVVEVCDRWYGLDSDYFKVRADDGCLYLLERDTRRDRWSLRYVRTREPATPVIPSAGADDTHLH